MSGFDRLLGALRATVQALVGRVDYLALYPCKVVAQQASGLLDLRPETPRLPDLSGVPLRVGLPGARVEVPQGGRVLVGFEGGDPRLPFACLFETGATATKIKLDATEIVLNGGGARVARVGDATEAHAHTVTHALVAPPGGGPVTGTITVSSEAPLIEEGAPGVLA